ncbi:MAG: septum formation initiator family protein [Chloroflexota bacterium]
MIDNLEVIPIRRARTDPRQGTRAARPTMFIPLLVVGALLSLLYLNQTSDVAATGYDIADLQAQQGALTMRNEQLRLEVAQLESLDRVDREATARLHMGPPRQVVYATAAVVAIPSPTPLATPSQSGPASPATLGWRWLIGQLGALIPTTFATDSGGG